MKHCNSHGTFLAFFSNETSVCYTSITPRNICSPHPHPHAHPTPPPTPHPHPPPTPHPPPPPHPHPHPPMYCPKSRNSSAVIHPILLGHTWEAAYFQTTSLCHLIHFLEILQFRIVSWIISYFGQDLSVSAKVSFNSKCWWSTMTENKPYWYCQILLVMDRVNKLT